MTSNPTATPSHLYLVLYLAETLLKFASKEILIWSGPNITGRVTISTNINM